MEQRDYILREVEKIGLILKAIRQKLLGGTENTATVLEKQIQDVKEMLLDEIDFDLDIFLSLNVEDSNKYIDSFEGFNVENIELLAECISQMGFTDKSDNSKKHLEKALQLYELCKLKSKTYSFDREVNMIKIKDAL